MNIEKNGASHATVTPTSSDIHTRGQTFEVEEFKGHLAVRINDWGNPEQVTVAMIAEGKRYTFLMDTLCVSINQLLEAGVSMDQICDRYLSRRVVSMDAPTVGSDSTEESLYMFVWCWLRKEFPVKFSETKTEPIDPAQQQLSEVRSK